VKRNFGLETTELIYRLLQTQFYNLYAKHIASKSDFYKLKSDATVGLFFPWTILKYERISSDSTDDQLIVSATSTHPLEFRRQLEFLKKNCTVISLTELVQLIKTGEAISPTVVVITFDGGFKNNFENAAPILRELQLPATFFVPTSLIDTYQLAWQDQVSAAVSLVTDSKGYFPLLSSIEPAIANQLAESFNYTKNKLLLARGVVAAIELLPPTERANSLEEISNLIVDINYEEPERAYMTWDELRKCQEQGIEIGSLGRFATPLIEMSKEELAEELHLSYDALFSNGINPSRVFALPKGSITSDSEKFLFEMGFPFVVGDNFFSPFISNEKAQILKRISINNTNCQTLERFICRIAQVKKPLSNDYY